MFEFNKSIIKIIITFTVPILLFLCVIPNAYQFYEHTEIPIGKVRTYSNDNKITISWSGFCKTPNKLYLDIYDSDKHLIERVSINRFVNSYDFTAGEHGKLYYFDLQVVSSNEEVVNSFKKESLYICYSNLPQLPILNITTKENRRPTYTRVNPPEGYWGIGITDNDYVEGQLSLSSPNNMQLLSAKVSIKIRGNTTALASKAPYKLRFEDDIDLCMTENSSKSKEWVLLHDGTSLATCFGSMISSECRDDWQPSFRYVNVMLNGDWRGCYILMESIEEMEEKCSISSDGFLIENDPYFWNESIYFRTPTQFGTFGYTFKFPSQKDINEEKIKNIQTYMSGVEELIYSDNLEYTEVIDEESFAQWVLTHDIIGSADFAGSNMYMYNTYIDVKSGESDLLKMGATWDINGIMGVNDEWTIIHNSEVFYYNKLFSYDSFKEVYRNQWKLKRDKIVKNTMQEFNDYVETHAEALQASWDLDSARYKKTYVPVVEQKNIINIWMKQRVEWIEENIEKL